MGKTYKLIIILLSLSFIFFLLNLYSFSDIESKITQEFGITIEENNQVQKLIDSVSILDNDRMTFGAVYKYNEDDGFVLLSNRTSSYENSYFDPLLSDEFIDDVLHNTDSRNGCHSIIIPFKPKMSPNRDMYVSYRWIPSYKMYNSYLVVTGISKYSLNISIPIIYYISSVVKFIFTGLICIFILLELRNKQEVNGYDY